MPYVTELKIAGIILAIIIIYFLFIRPVLQRKRRLILERFLHVQSFSLNMQDLILHYVLKHDAMRKEVMPGVTFKEYLKSLQRKHSLYLSDKRYKKLKKQNVLVSSLWINGMLDGQEARLIAIESELSKLDVRGRKHQDSRTLMS